MDDRRALLEWFRPRRLVYPWRREPPDPYRVLVSEVMLQQTQAARVAAAFPAFVERFPSLPALAAASRAEVVRAWAGLGYNRRAIALSDAARAIVRARDGGIPGDPSELVMLPGVGPYTGAAVAAIAFDFPVAAVDTNVARVVARVRLGREPAEVSAAEVSREADAWLDEAHPGWWNQALMDLGRTHCRPAPRCDTCPLVEGCRSHRAGRRHGGPRTRARQQPFEGSSRQLRGRVIAELRARERATLGALASVSGRPLDQVARAVRGLHADGLVAAGPAALAGSPTGRVSLRG